MMKHDTGEYEPLSRTYEIYTTPIEEYTKSIMIVNNRSRMCYTATVPTITPPKYAITHRTRFCVH